VAQGGEQGAGHQLQGTVVIESRGLAHRIGFTVDPVRQTPVVSRREESSEVKTGTRITARLPDSAKLNCGAC
jgi:hypothetical protein